MRRALVVPLLAVALLCAASAQAEKPQRDLVVMPKVPAGSVSIGGEYWALIIGIDKYRSVDPLETAVHDAEAVRDVLIGRYGFARERVTLLLNEQATRKGIEDALYRLRKKVGKEDSVLIYYAGHGQMDREDEIGYWVPVEGEAQSPGTFINNAVIRDEVAAMKAKHVYLVADSCFSGSLFAKSRALPPLNDKFFARLYEKKSRWGLTSGQNEPVADRGKDGHSMFAYFFLQLLRDNEEPYLVPSHIFEQVARLVSNNSSQQPRSQPLQNAGDEGGQFVFRLAVTAAKQPSAASVGSAASAELEAERQRMQAERDAFEQEKREADERAKLEAERKKNEEARVRPYEEPKSQAKTDEQNKLVKVEIVFSTNNNKAAVEDILNRSKSSIAATEDILRRFPQAVFVSAQEVLDSTEAGKKIKGYLQAYVKDRQAKIDAYEDRLKKMEKTLITNPSNDAGEKMRREEEFRREMTAYQNLVKELNREVQEEKKRVLDVFNARLEKGVRRVAEKKGLSLVLESPREEFGLPVFNSSSDITKLVIEEVGRQ